MGRATQAITEASRLIRSARYLTAFTGAGISVESGIPPFRGAGGLWSRYDPRMLELDYFLAHPERSWPILREIFYDHFRAARPNRAHEVLAAWEARGLLMTVITQNVDNLHRDGGIMSLRLMPRK
jgi:NAD-dependent deacetylase